MFFHVYNRPKELQKLVICQGGALNLASIAHAEGQRGLQKCIIFGERPLQLNLKSLAMQAGQNSMAARRRQRPIFEVLWV
jgi:hypothetical protein